MTNFEAFYWDFLSSIYPKIGMSEWTPIWYNLHRFIAVKEMEDMTLDELDELEDEEEERILEQYKRARMAEIKAMQGWNQVKFIMVFD